MPHAIRIAVIPAAGRGQRLRPISAFVPKEMFPIGRYPAIEWVVAEAVSSGCSEIAVVTNSSKTLVRSYLSQAADGAKERCEMRFYNQESPQGMAHAILQARELLAEDAFAVLLPDELFDGEPPLARLAEAQAMTAGTVIAVTRESRLRAARYGSLELRHVEDRLFELRGIGPRGRLPPGGPVLAGMGRYVLPPLFLEYAASLCGVGFDGEVDDAVVIQRMIDANEPVHCVEVPGRRYDTSTSDGFIAAWDAFSDREPQWSHL